MSPAGFIKPAAVLVHSLSMRDASCCHRCRPKRPTQADGRFPKGEKCGRPRLQIRGSPPARLTPERKLLALCKPTKATRTQEPGNYNYSSIKAGILGTPLPHPPAPLSHPSRLGATGNNAAVYHPFVPQLVDSWFALTTRFRWLSSRRHAHAPHEIGARISPSFSW